MKRTIATFVVVAVPALAASPAVAGPSSSPNAELLTVTCSNGFTGTVIGTSPVGHLEGGAAIGVLKEINGERISGQGIDASRLVTCTAAEEPGVIFGVFPVPQGG